MSLGTILGYFLVACATFGCLDQLLTLNPVKWIIAILGAPLSLLPGVAILVISGAPPTTQQIIWYIDGTITLAALMFIARAYEQFELATGRKKLVKGVLLDSQGNTTGYIQ
jgi:hypothetical protein